MARKILIFAPGTIGDMVTAMPAMKRLRDFYRGDILHLHNTYPGTNDCHRTLFEHLGWFEKMRFTHVDPRLFASSFRRFANWCELFGERYDAIWELPCNVLSPRWLLRAFGAKRLEALDRLEPDGIPRCRFLLDFLAARGIPRVPGDERIDFAFTAAERRRVDDWWSALSVPDGKIPFALCVGGKRKLQRWPMDRYVGTLQMIVKEYPLFPVIFGSAEERGDAELVIRECGGVFSQDREALSLREIVLALSRCRFYFGNNTGVMHLAGAAGIGGVVVSSARDPRGYWEPMSDMKMLTADVRCLGCRGESCRRGDPPPCLAAISVDRAVGELRVLLE